MFQKDTAIAIDKIYHPSIVNEWKDNMERSSCEEKRDSCFYIPSKTSKFSQTMNADHWPKWLLNEIEWFQFQGILEHAAFHENGDNILFHSLLKVFHMFLIRLWKDGGLNAKVICIKYKNCGRTVTHHLEREEELKSMIAPFLIHMVFRMLDYHGSLRRIITPSLNWI